ncbi:MAG: SAM-dependent methyltransferase, partial [Chloroflexia bacterium]
TKNYSGTEAEEKLDELIGLPFKNFHVETAGRVMQVNLSKKGKPLILDKAVVEKEKKPINLSHNREKDLILPADKPVPFLHLTGIMTQDGKIKSDMHSKFRQINEYLKLVDQTGVLGTLKAAPVRVVDFGCGNAYLTFATYHYLTNTLGLETEMIGVDVQSNLLERHVTNARTLGWDGLTFEAARIVDYKPGAPAHVVLALHACDTATDEAIAQGIGWQSRLIITAPCCHHDLQAQLNNHPFPSPFNPISRYGILSERLGDILTDTFRALTLRIMGYRTDVVQFVSTEHTAKNLMIRAVGGLRVGDPKFVREYNELKKYWNVTPYLENLLGDSFTRLLAGTVSVQLQTESEDSTALLL